MRFAVILQKESTGDEVVYSIFESAGAARAEAIMILRHVPARGYRIVPATADMRPGTTYRGRKVRA